MIPNPIIKVLSTIQKHRVRALLMGGQACVLYGAVQFSCDVDFVILADGPNLTRLRKALADLAGTTIAVPDFALEHLRRGLAIHFRCEHPDAEGLRVDIMSKMRGVDAFPALWRRRTVVELSDGTICSVLSVPDLVQAKKTQRDKDWPMIRKLVDTHRQEHLGDATPVRVKFWLRELRTPEVLIRAAKAHPRVARGLVGQRPLLEIALRGAEDELQNALAVEEANERKLDKEYWDPLRKVLGDLRRQRVKTSKKTK